MAIFPMGNFGRNPSESTTTTTSVWIIFVCDHTSGCEA